MLSGRDPGELGIYGFRNRRDHSYDNLAIADSRAVQVDRVFDLATKAGKRVIIQGIPQTSPPVAVNGAAVSCFLIGTPSRGCFRVPVLSG